MLPRNSNSSSSSSSREQRRHKEAQVPLTTWFPHNGAHRASAVLGRVCSDRSRCPCRQHLPVRRRAERLSLLHHDHSQANRHHHHHHHHHHHLLWRLPSRTSASSTTMQVHTLQGSRRRHSLHSSCQRFSSCSNSTRITTAVCCRGTG